MLNWMFISAEGTNGTMNSDSSTIEVEVNSLTERDRQMTSSIHEKNDER